MYKSLMPDLLSIRADLKTTVALAVAHGFAGVDAGAGGLAAPNLDIDGVQNALQEAGIRPGYVIVDRDDRCATAVSFRLPGLPHP